jgi:hypothetical protein
VFEIKIKYISLFDMEIIGLQIWNKTLMTFVWCIILNVIPHVILFISTFFIIVISQLIWQIISHFFCFLGVFGGIVPSHGALTYKSKFQMSQKKFQFANGQLGQVKFKYHGSTSIRFVFPCLWFYINIVNGCKYGERSQWDYFTKWLWKYS